MGVPPATIFFLEFELGSLATLRVTLLVDHTSLIFGTILAIVAINAYCYGLTYLEREVRPFFLGLTYFVLRIYLLIFAADLLRVFIAWDGLGISSVVLVFYYDKPAAAAARSVTLFTNRVGDVALLLGVVGCLFMGHGSVWVDQGLVSSLLFMVAAATKRAQ